MIDMDSYWVVIERIYSTLREKLIKEEQLNKSINSRCNEDVLHDAILYVYNKELSTAKDIEEAIIKEYKQIRFRNLMDNSTCYIVDNAEMVADIIEE